MYIVHSIYEHSMYFITNFVEYLREWSEALVFMWKSDSAAHGTAVSLTPLWHVQLSGDDFGTMPKSGGYTLWFIKDKENRKKFFDQMNFIRKVMLFWVMQYAV
jgi:hypothetical protein